jgi:hypothetical protein
VRPVVQEYVVVPPELLELPELLAPLEELLELPAPLEELLDPDEEAPPELELPEAAPSSFASSLASPPSDSRGLPSSPPGVASSPLCPDEPDDDEDEDGEPDELGEPDEDDAPEDAPPDEPPLEEEPLPLGPNWVDPLLPHAAPSAVATTAAPAHAPQDPSGRAQAFIEAPFQSNVPVSITTAMIVKGRNRKARPKECEEVVKPCLVRSRCRPASRAAAARA